MKALGYIGAFLGGAYRRYSIRYSFGARKG